MNRKTIVIACILIFMLAATVTWNMQIIQTITIHSEATFDGYCADGGSSWDGIGNLAATEYGYTLIGESWSTTSWKYRYRTFLKFDISGVTTDDSPITLAVYMYGMKLPDGWDNSQGANLIGNAILEQISDYGSLDANDFSDTSLNPSVLGSIISTSDPEKGWKAFDVTSSVHSAINSGSTYVCFRIRVATDPTGRSWEDCLETSCAMYKLNTGDSSANKPKLYYDKDVSGDLPPATNIPELRGLFFHSSDCPSTGRLSTPSYYEPFLDLAVQKLYANWLQVSLWYIEEGGGLHGAGTDVVPHTMESVEEVKTFIQTANAKGLHITIRLFDYPYGGGIWSDWDNAGYFDLSDTTTINKQLAWLEYYITGLKGVNVHNYIIKNEPYWKYDSNPTYAKMEHIHEWVLYMADKVKQYDPNAKISYGSLHPYRQYSAPQDWANPSSADTIAKFDIVDFHYYGPQDPAQSWGDPETETPLMCVQKMAEYAKSYNKKCQLGEFGYWDHKVGQDGNITLRVQQYDELLSACQRYDLEGVLSWGFPYRSGYRWNLLKPSGGLSLIDQYSLNEVGEKLAEYYYKWKTGYPNLPPASENGDQPLEPTEPTLPTPPTGIGGEELTLEVLAIFIAGIIVISMVVKRKRRGKQ